MRITVTPTSITMMCVRHVKHRKHLLRLLTYPGILAIAARNLRDDRTRANQIGVHLAPAGPKAYCLAPCLGGATVTDAVRGLRFTNFGRVQHW